MRYLTTYLILLLLFSSEALVCQLSPGDLSNPHKEYEGISNCTLCHELGNKVLNTKCLDCHKDIQSLLSEKKGFHVSKEVKDKDCFTCHSDHHGRNFDMIRFDEKEFDHDLAGYELKGEHGFIDCKECHRPDYIQDIEIKRRRNTFLGLGVECLSCHEDYHQSTLSDDCASCHDENDFSPTVNFDHDDSNYKLRGKHEEVDCIECHKETIRRGMSFQEFTDLKFVDCIDCHEDPHDEALPGKCNQCHVVSDFSKFMGRKRFNHDKTKFKLKGKHKSTKCFVCHQQSHEAENIFQDLLGKEEANCNSCHEDIHEGKFGTQCVDCHLVTGFNSFESMDGFDHDMTDYHIEGKHIGVACKECHKGKMTEPIAYETCNSCHEDYHQGELKKDGLVPDCVECHSLLEGFGYSLFSLEDHNETAFPLEGAHEATPCFECHVSEDQWSFRDIGVRCVDCHTDIHDGFIEPKYYPKNDCTNCHVSDAWDISNFDHSTTEWALEGKHRDAACRSCHFDFPEGKIDFVQKFKGLKNTCNDCHDDVHDQQFAEEGITDCKGCHSPKGWDSLNFNHDDTDFPLKGKHESVTCKECHIPEERNGKIFVDYQIKQFECIDCHQ